MKIDRDYDMAVLGGGAAGLAAAIMSSNLGARTVLVEERRLGGDCTFIGCVPSKTLLHIASLFRDARAIRSFSMSEDDITVNFQAVMKHVHRVRERIYEADDAAPNLESRGIEVLYGRARFVGSHELEIASAEGTVHTVRFRYAIIATGSEPQKLRTSLPCLTNETLFELDVLPQRLVIAGAGPVGIEMAQAFTRLGSAVTVVAPESVILPKDDAECALIVQSALKRENVRFAFGRTVTEFDEQDGRSVAVLDDGTRIGADALLAAIGRKPRLADCGLAQAGVETANGKIVYDARARTTAKHIFVSGDVAGWYEFTHAAEHMSRIAVTNALLRLPAKLDGRSMAWATFTQPELAHAGQTQAQLEERGVRFTVHRMPYARIDRAVTDDATEGLIKIFANGRGNVLGATIVGERAGDLIAEWTLAIRKRLLLRDLSSTIHVYPSYALGSKRLADEWYGSRLASTVVPLARRLFGYGRGR